MRKEDKVVNFFLILIIVGVFALMFVALPVLMLKEGASLSPSEKISISKQTSAELLKDNIFPYGKDYFNSAGENFISMNEDKIINREAYYKNHKGYIILLKEEPLSKVYLKNKNSPNLQNDLSLQKERIEFEHNNLKNRFNSNIKISREFTKVLNAIVVNDLTTEKINELKEEGYTVTPNFEVHATLMDSVPLINADDVWKLNAQKKSCVLAAIPSVGGQPGPSTNNKCITGRGVKIGIIDTGVDYTHPDLGGCLGENCKVIGGYDFANNDNDPKDDMGHGTHVAATAAGNGDYDKDGKVEQGEGLNGVAPDANIVSYKVLDRYGSGPDSDIIAAIEMSADPNNDGDFSDHLDIISLSLGGWCHLLGYSTDCGPDDPMSTAIDNVFDIGVISTIAAGNDGREESINSPGTARKAITVGAIRKSKKFAEFSSEGPIFWDKNGQTAFLLKPDVVAPGVNICAAEYDNWAPPSYSCLDTKHISITGTSMATPHVAGLVALIKQRNQAYTPEEIKTIIKNTADLLSDSETISRQGFGLVEALESVFFDNPLVVNLDEIIVTDALSLAPITGEIKGDNFAAYSISYAQNLPLLELQEGDWTEIYVSSVLPDDNILYNQNFDLSQLISGDYLLRLEIIDAQGRKLYDYGYFSINRYDALLPLNGDLLNPKSDIFIQVDNKYDLVIDNFEVQYSFNGGAWTIEGVEIVDSQNLKAKILANTITQQGILEIRLKITSNGFTENVNINEIFIDVSLKEGWPIFIDRHKVADFDAWYWLPISFSVGNLVGDEKKEIVFPVMDPEYNKIVILSSDGELLRTIPISERERDIDIKIALGNLDEDSYDEIIFYTGTSLEKIYAQNYDGSDVDGWPVNLGRKQANADLMIEDIDRNGDVEIIMVGDFEYYAMDNAKVYVFNANGDELNQFNLHHKNLDYGVDYNPAIGNFDEDSDFELFVPEYNDGIRKPSLYVYNFDGTVVNGWPVTIDGVFDVAAQSAATQIDDDEKNEILITMYDRAGSDIILTAYDDDGTVVNGWPKSFGEDVILHYALANVIDGESPEIFLKKSHVYYDEGNERPSEFYVIDKTGNTLMSWIGPKDDVEEDFQETLNYFMTSRNYIGSASDQYQNAILSIAVEGGQYKLHAYNKDGIVIQGFPKLFGKNYVRVLEIADVDADGKTEIIVVAKSKKIARDSLYVFELDADFDESQQHWPKQMHDKYNTNCYNCLFSQCSDGVDNDGDTLIDLNDLGCEDSEDDDETNCGDGVCEGGENWIECSADCPQMQCFDNIDNDNDGAIDYPLDFSCSDQNDNDEENPKAECQDGIDNDGDGRIDYPADSNCDSSQDNKEESEFFRVFVTSQKINGGLGGVSGADQKCQEIATNANLGGNWKSWISDNQNQAKDRLYRSISPYKKLNGITIARDWSDLVDGNLLSPININEFLLSENNQTYVWTGTNSDGTAYLDKNCNSWLSENSGDSGRSGTVNSISSTWTSRSDFTCNSLRSLYCFEQP